MFGLDGLSRLTHARRLQVHRLFIIIICQRSIWLQTVVSALTPLKLPVALLCLLKQLQPSACLIMFLHMVCL